ncbi:uncharacterized protein LOC144582820 [Callithrix jacchus]
MIRSTFKRLLDQHWVQPSKIQARWKVVIKQCHKTGRSVKNYINSQLDLIRFLLTALGARALQQQQQQQEEVEVEEEESTSLLGGGGGRPREKKEQPLPAGHRAPSTQQVEALDQPLPSPAVTRPAAPRPGLLGPGQSLGEHRFPGTSFSLAATGLLDPSVPPRARRSSERPNPRLPSARPGPPIPGQPPGTSPTRRAAPRSGSPRVPEPLPGAQGRDPAVPELPRARGSAPLQPPPPPPGLGAPSPPLRPRPAPRDTYGLLLGRLGPQTAAGRGAARQGGGAGGSGAAGSPSAPGRRCGAEDRENGGLGRALELAAGGAGWRARGSDERAHFSTQPGARPSVPSCARSTPGQSFALSAAARAPPLVLWPPPNPHPFCRGARARPSSPRPGGAASPGAPSPATPAPAAGSAPALPPDAIGQVPAARVRTRGGRRGGEAAPSGSGRANEPAVGALGTELRER